MNLDFVLDIFFPDKYRKITTNKHHIISLFILQQMLTFIFDCFENTTTTTATENEDFIGSKYKYIEHFKVFVEELCVFSETVKTQIGNFL